MSENSTKFLRVVKLSSPDIYLQQYSTRKRPGWSPGRLLSIAPH
jgi:hypothetical protein